MSSDRRWNSNRENVYFALYSYVEIAMHNFIEILELKRGAA